MAEQRLPYYLSRTFLSVTGTRTTEKNLNSGLDESSCEASIELGVEADPDDYYLLNLDGSGLTDMDFTLEFTDDQRLRSANSVVTGRGSTILEGAAKILGTLANPALATALVRTASAVDAKTGTSSETDSEESSGDEDIVVGNPCVYPATEQRERAKQVASDLSARVVKLGEKAAAGSADNGQLKATLKALDAVRSEIAYIEAHYSAWQMRERNLRVEEFNFRIPIDSVPLRSTLGDGTPLSDDATKMLQALEMVVAHDPNTEKGPDDDPDPKSSESGHETESIWYRRPFYTDLVLTRCVNKRWEDIDRSRQLVVGQDSHKTELPIKRSAWGKRTLDLGFSELGTAIKIATSQTSAAADAISALSGLPGHASSGLDSAAAFSAAAAAVPDARVTRAIARLENDKKLVLAEIGDDAAADAALVAEVSRLENEKQRLTLLKDLGRSVS